MNREQTFECSRIFHFNIPSSSLPTCFNNNIVVGLHHLCDSSIPATLMMILVVYLTAGVFSNLF